MKQKNNKFNIDYYALLDCIFKLKKKEIKISFVLYRHTKRKSKRTKV